MCFACHLDYLEALSYPDMDVDNMVRRSFIEIENKYQKFFDAQQVCRTHSHKRLVWFFKDIEIPLDGNEAKIQKYHDQLTKLRTQVLLLFCVTWLLVTA